MHPSASHPGFVSTRALSVRATPLPRQPEAKGKDPTGCLQGSVVREGGLGASGYWLLVVWGQGCWQTSYHVQDRPTSKNYLAQNANRAEGEKLWSTIVTDPNAPRLIPTHEGLCMPSFKTAQLSLAGVAEWIECQPANQRAAGSIPSQSACLGCGSGPQ